MLNLSIFPYKNIREQSWPCREIGQGQLRIIIWTNFVGQCPLYTKFKCHWPGDFGDFFKRFLPYMGMVATLIIWPGSFEQTFIPPFHWWSTWNLAMIGPAVPEEKMSAWRKLGPLATHWVHSKDSDQAGRMPRLIWSLRWAHGQFVGFVMRQLKCACYCQFFVRLFTQWQQLQENIYNRPLNSDLSCKKSLLELIYFLMLFLKEKF